MNSDITLLNFYWHQKRVVFSIHHKLSASPKMANFVSGMTQLRQVNSKKPSIGRSVPTNGFSWVQGESCRQSDASASPVFARWICCCIERGSTLFTFQFSSQRFKYLPQIMVRLRYIRTIQSATSSTPCSLLTKYVYSKYPQKSSQITD